MEEKKVSKPEANEDLQMDDDNEHFEEIKLEGLDINPEEGNDEYECIEEYFVDCCRFADIDEIKDCIDNEIDITWFNKYLNNGIHMAAANGHIKVLEILMSEVEKQKFDQEKKMKFLNHKNSDGNTPLHWAVINNKLDVVEFLIKHQADTSIKNQLLRNPFEEALELQRTEILEFLAKNTKPDLENYESDEGEDFQVATTKDDAIEEQQEEEQEVQIQKGQDKDIDQNKDKEKEKEKEKEKGKEEEQIKKD